MPTEPRPTITTCPRIPGISAWPSDWAIRRDTSVLVRSAKIVVTSVVPARIRQIPKISIQVGWVENEKSPKPTVAIVSTVK
jgi:hypothetical protein